MLVVVMFVVALVFLARAGVREEARRSIPPTIDGPENGELTHRLVGTLLVESGQRSRRVLRAIRYPGGDIREVPLTYRALAFSNLDDRGNFVYLTTSAAGHGLRAAQVQGKEERWVLRREERIYRVETRLSLSPDGRRILILDDVEDPMMRRPKNRFELVTIEGESLLRLDVAYDMTCGGWRDDTTAIVHAEGKAFLVDTTDGTFEVIEELASRITHGRGDQFVAWNPTGMGSQRGRRFDWQERAFGEPFGIPGFNARLIGVAADGLIVYEGLATTGTPQHAALESDILPQIWKSLKVCDPETEEFATLLPCSDGMHVTFSRFRLDD